MSILCLKCQTLLAGPGTPAGVWNGRQRVRGWLCPVCLDACRGSLLYSVLIEDLHAMDDQTRRAWMDSLLPVDRAAAEKLFP